MKGSMPTAGNVYSIIINGYIVEDCFCVYGHQNAPNSVCFAVVANSDIEYEIRKSNNGILICNAFSSFRETDKMIVCFCISKSKTFDFIKKSNRSKTQKMFNNLLRNALAESALWTMAEFRSGNEDCSHCNLLYNSIYKGSSEAIAKQKKCIGGHVCNTRKLK